MKETRAFLKKIGMPEGDAYNLPTSEKRFSDAVGAIDFKQLDSISQVFNDDNQKTYKGKTVRQSLDQIEQLRKEQQRLISLQQNLNLLRQLDNQINIIGNIKEEIFGQSAEQRKEFNRLTSLSGPALGRGESACMVYCRFNHDVVGSSNIADVTSYCEEYGITYLTTNDFLFYGIRRGIITKEQADDFIKEVRSKGSCPQVVDFETYICTKI